MAGHTSPDRLVVDRDATDPTSADPATAPPVTATRASATRASADRVAAALMGARRTVQMGAPLRFRFPGEGSPGDTWAPRAMSRPAPAVPDPRSETRDIDGPLHLPELLWTDATQVFKAPGQWSGQDRHLAWLCASGLVATLVLLDGPARDESDRLREDGRQRRWDHIGSLGGETSLWVAGGTYLTGLVFQAPGPRAVGTDMIMTMAISQLVFVRPLKSLVGRSQDDPHRFSPFAGGRSFPSGHTTQAFAMASVLAAHTDNPWVQSGCYAVATLVGVARVAQGAHYPSDVLVGALIGTVVGQVVVRTNEGLRHGGGVSATLEPALVQGNPGLALRIRF